MKDADNYTEVMSADGQKTFTYSYVEKLRENSDDFDIIAQRGGQENMLACTADIEIGGGNRGGSKSFTMEMKPQYNIYDKGFKGIILRKEVDDLGKLISDSHTLYDGFGLYNRSKNDMTWNFFSGGSVTFSYYGGNFDDFRDRFQGREYPYIGIDEITQMEYEKFKYLLTVNRNPHSIPNHIFGTCNPDPDSWVAKFIHWWIDDDGDPIPERDGVLRYCFMNGDSVEDITWGDNRLDVYERCRDIIDRYYTDDYRKFGRPEDIFIKSVTFVHAKLADNIKLIGSDPAYLANLMNQSEEQRNRDLRGNWKHSSSMAGLVSATDMEDFFSRPMLADQHIRYMTCDPAFTGGDNCVFWIWEGWNIIGVYVCRRDSKETVDTARYLLKENLVLEENFAYDLNGIGQIFTGFFPKAMKFNNIECPSDGSHVMFDTLKSEVAYKFVQRMTTGGVAIKPELLSRRFSGKGFLNEPLSDVLMRERLCMKQDETVADKHWKLIAKAEMKRLVGHSPDFWESMMTRTIFDIKHTHRIIKGIGLL